MPYIFVPYISGQYSGLDNELLMTNDKHRVIFNGSFNKFGKLETRAGNTLVNDLGASTILGMHDASFEDGTHVHLATLGTQVFNAQSGAAFSGQGFTAGQNMEFANFLNLCFVVNGVDAMGHFDKNGAFATTNCVGAPVANYIAKYGARVWTNDVTNKRRVHRSLTPVAGVIAWDTATEYFDMESAGDLVTGLHPARNTMMAFTNEDVEIRYFNRAKLGVLTGVGTLSPRSIITKQGKTYWFHHDTDNGFAGIMQYSGTGADEATLISTPVQDIFNAMSPAFNDNVVVWQEGATLVWYLGGSITMDYGIVNAVSLNLKNNAWSCWYIPYTIVAASTFLNGTTLSKDSYIADDAGKILKRTGVKDESTDIEAFLISKALSADDPMQYNQFQSVVVKGSQFGSSRAIHSTNAQTTPKESRLVPHYSGKDIFKADLGSSGTDISLKIALNDQVGQSIKGYKVLYSQSSAKQ